MGGKKESENSIGRFGLGFKSVFQYTSSVEIHSGAFHFALQDYVYIVDKISVPSNLEFGAQGTYFRFIFDDMVLDSEIAAQEIESIMRMLNHRTILFLNNDVVIISFNSPISITGQLKQLFFWIFLTAAIGS